MYYVFCHYFHMQMGSSGLQAITAVVYSVERGGPADRAGIRAFDPDVLYYSSERTDAWELPIPDLSYITDFFGTLFSGWDKPAWVLLEEPHGSIYPDDMLRRLPQADLVLRGETEPDHTISHFDELRRILIERYALKLPAAS